MLTREEAAQELIDWHYTIDPRMTQAIRLLSANEDDPREPLKFLEATPNIEASGVVTTFTFGPADNFPYSMRIANIAPEEMEQVRRGEIALPEGWSLENSVTYPAPVRRSREGSQKRSQEGAKWRRSVESVRPPSVRCNRPKPLPASRMKSGSR